MKQASMFLMMSLLAISLAAFTAIQPPALGGRFLHTEMMEFQPDYYNMWYILEYTGATTWQVDSCNVNTGEWVNLQTLAITYEDGRPTEVNGHAGSELYRYTFVYRDAPNEDTISSTTISYYEEGTWVEIMRETYTYTDDNQLTYSLTEYCLEGTWYPVGRGTATYEGGVMTEILVEEYQFGGGWVNDDQMFFTWNGGDLYEVVWQDWTGEAWQNDQRILYTFNDDGNLIQDYGYWWDGSQWNDGFRRNCTYSGDLRTYELEEELQDNVWVNNYQSTYTYDEQDRILSVVRQDWSGDAWQNTDRETWGYSTAVDNDATTEPSASLRAYPNPFNPSTTVAFSLAQPGSAELTVYNVRGQSVRSLVNDQLPAGEHFATWDGRDDSGRAVSSGVYLAVLRANGATTSTRLVLLK